MAEPDLLLREAEQRHCDLVFAWANDPQTRAASCSQEPIIYQDHCRWYAASLSSPRRRLLIAELAGEPCALLRLDQEAPGARRAEVSINIAPGFRGRGLGIELLRLLSRRAAELGLARLVAFIRPDNEASRRAFAGAGYRQAAEPSEVRGALVERWELSPGEGRPARSGG